MNVYQNNSWTVKFYKYIITTAPFYESFASDTNFKTNVLFTKTRYGIVLQPLQCAGQTLMQRRQSPHETHLHLPQMLPHQHQTHHLQVHQRQNVWFATGPDLLKLEVK